MPKKPTTALTTAEEASQSLLKRQDQFITAYMAKACNITQACAAIGISRETYYRWCYDSDDFKKRILAAREELVDYAEGTLLTLIKEKNVTATIYFLKTQGKHRGYSE